MGETANFLPVLCEPKGETGDRQGRGCPFEGLLCHSSRNNTDYTVCFEMGKITGRWEQGSAYRV